MICEQLIGRLDNMDVSGKNIEYVEIEWDEAFKKIHKKTTDQGRQVGIRMDDSVLVRGLYEGDVIYEEDGLVIAVHTPPCEVIDITFEPGHTHMIPKVCYEIGNRHAQLFFGGSQQEFVTPYNEPMLQMLGKLHGVCAERRIQRLDFSRRISSGAGGHHHH